MGRKAAPRTRPVLEVLRPSPAPELHQQRSRRSYQALVDAATEMFATLPYDAVSTPDIAAKAGVSVGSFYRYFDDKHAVYLDLVRRDLSDAYDATMAGLTPQRFVGRARRDTIAASVAVLFDHVLRRPLLSRSFMEMSLRDAACAEIRRAFEDAAVARMSELIAAVCPRDVIADPTAAAYVVYGSVMHCAYGLAGHVGKPPVDARRAQTALVDFLERALFPAS
jgi:AcrR family transcriptional regulator